MRRAALLAGAALLVGALLLKRRAAVAASVGSVESAGATGPSSPAPVVKNARSSTGERRNPEQDDKRISVVVGLQSGNGAVI